MARPSEIRSFAFPLSAKAGFAVHHLGGAF